VVCEALKAANFTWKFAHEDTKETTKVLNPNAILALSADQAARFFLVLYRVAGKSAA
jgi:hypothetical protein